MPATVDIIRLTGASTGTPNTITGINTRANAFDSHTTADTTSPVQIPAAGTNYSYWVSTRLTVGVTPAGTINNLRWYSGGTNNLGTGVGCVGMDATTYAIATGTPGQTGNQLTTGAYATLTGAPIDVFANYQSGTPKSLAGSLSNPTTGQFGSLFVYQITVGTTALPGATAQTTFTWKYDET